MYKDKWEEICFYLKENIKNDISESQFEHNVIQALRVLGWKQHLGDFDIRPPYQLGSTKRATPDIVIKSSDNRKLFIIEIKQPNIPFTSNFQQQLFSYLRLFKLEYGILLGQGIQIFYDGVLVEQEDPILLETIRFEKDNEKGEKFVELFSKENFDFELLNKFTLDVLEKLNQKEVQKKLKNEILSNNYKNKLTELIKQDFINEYDGELIDSVLAELDIEIIDKNVPKTNLNQASKQYSQTKKYNFSSTEKDRFKNWLVENGYSENTSNSYSSFINRISKHISNERNEEINVYFIDDLSFLKELVESYSQTGNYSKLGYEGSGTLRNAINRLYEFRKVFKSVLD